MSSEQWRDVAGHEGAYQVSDQGRVRSLGRQVMRKNGRPIEIRERILRPGRTDGGVQYVCLRLGGKTCTISVRAAVAAAFIGPMPAGHEVYHISGDPSDCGAGNLAYRAAPRSGEAA